MSITEEAIAELAALRTRLHGELPPGSAHKTFRALGHRVLAVASVTVDVDWAAYIGPVAGQSHADEWPEVARHGDKLPQHIAEALFPQIAECYDYRR